MVAAILILILLASVPYVYLMLSAEYGSKVTLTIIFAIVAYSILLVIFYRLSTRREERRRRRLPKELEEQNAKIYGRTRRCDSKHRY